MKADVAPGLQNHNPVQGGSFAMPFKHQGVTSRESLCTTGGTAGNYPCPGLWSRVRKPFDNAIHSQRSQALANKLDGGGPSGQQAHLTGRGQFTSALANRGLPSWRDLNPLVREAPRGWGFPTTGARRAAQRNASGPH